MIDKLIGDVLFIVTDGMTPHKARYFRRLSFTQNAKRPALNMRNENSHLPPLRSSSPTSIIISILETVAFSFNYAAPHILPSDLFETVPIELGRQRHATLQIQSVQLSEKLLRQNSARQDSLRTCE